MSNARFSGWVCFAGAFIASLGDDVGRVAGVSIFAIGLMVFTHKVVLKK